MVDTYEEMSEESVETIGSEFTDATEINLSVEATVACGMLLDPHLSSTIEKLTVSWTNQKP